MYSHGLGGKHTVWEKTWKREEHESGACGKKGPCSDNIAVQAWVRVRKP